MVHLLENLNKQKLKINTILLGLLILTAPSNLSKTIFRTCSIDLCFVRFFISDIFLYLYIFLNIKNIKFNLKLDQIFFILIYFFYELINPINKFSFLFFLNFFKFFLFFKIINTQKNKSQFLIFIKILYLFLFVLSLLQFIFQKNIFPFYILGESNLLSLNIKHIKIFNTIKIAPYANTPHPNILIFYMTILFFMLFYKTQNWFFSIPLLIIIFLTKSILGLTSFILFFIKIKEKYIKTYKIFIFILFFNIFFLFIFKNLNNSTFIRFILLKKAFLNIKNYPFFGTGVYNSFQTKNTYLRTNKQTLFIQPTHNIPLLLIEELGLYFILFIFLNLKKVNLKPLILIFPFLCFDHFLYTTQQGILGFIIFYWFITDN